MARPVARAAGSGSEAVAESARDGLAVPAGGHRMVKVLGLEAPPCAAERGEGVRQVHVLLPLAVDQPRAGSRRGVDGFALKRRHRYATVLNDAEAGEWVDVLPNRNADTPERWLREQPGAEIVCGDGSGVHGEAVRRVPPEAARAGDRLHVRKNLCGRIPVPSGSLHGTIGPPQDAIEAVVRRAEVCVGSTPSRAPAVCRRSDRRPGVQGCVATWRTAERDSPW